MGSVVLCAAALTVSAAAAIKFRHYRDERKPRDLAYLTIALLFLATFTLFSTPLFVSSARFAGPTSAAMILGSSATALVAGFAILKVAASIARPSSRGTSTSHYQPALFVTVALVGPGLYLWSKMFCESAVCVPTPVTHVASSIHLHLLAVSFLVLACQLHRMSQHDAGGDTPLRWSLRLSMWGSFQAGVATLWGSIERLDPGYPTWSTAVFGPISSYWFALHVICLAIGVTYATWAPLVRRALLGIVARRLTYQLAPLWKLLTSHLPEVELEGAGRGGMERLYRQVIEIRDVMLRLAPYNNPHVRHLVSEMQRASAETHRSRTRMWISGSNWDSILSASELVTALDAYRHRRRHGDRLPPSEQTVPGEHGDRGRTMFAEARQLARVARAITDSQLVSDIREDLRPPRSSLSHNSIAASE